jgi:hypothetical protein
LGCALPIEKYGNLKFKKVGEVNYWYMSPCCLLVAPPPERSNFTN